MIRLLPPLIGRGVPLLLLAVALAATPARAVTVDGADDLCASTADPCTITQAFDVAPGSTLDFGTRAVRLVDNGELDFGLGPAELICGDLFVASRGTGTRLFAKDGGVGGTLTLRARRGCSGSPAQACLADADCAGAGACSLGTGNVLLEGKLRGEGSPGATVTVIAANDLEVATLLGVENGGASPATADGGTLVLKAEAGAVTLTAGAELKVGGGGSAQAGSVEIEAGGDVTMAADVDAKGGDDSGGAIAITSGGTLTLGAHSLVSSNGVDAGSEAGVIELTACTLRVLDDAEITNEGQDGGRVVLGGDQSVEVEANAAISAVGSSGGSAGGIFLVTASLGVCSNDASIPCTANSECTVGCTAHECLTNPDTHGTFNQFDPVPTIVESPSTAPCN